MDIAKIELDFNVSNEDTPGYRILKVQNDVSYGMGKQLVVGFPNGYALSIIQNDYSYGRDEGLWEIGIAGWDVDTLKWGLVSFEVAEELLGLHDQVVGWLTPDDVTEWGKRVASLPHHKGLASITR